MRLRAELDECPRAEAFDQAVVQVKADKLRDERVSVLTPPQKSTGCSMPRTPPAPPSVQLAAT